MTVSSRRLGLLGGTFDPVHVGHLEAGRRACELLSLDEVMLVPAHRPPHRDGQPLASPWHRFAMVTLATAGHDWARVSDVELRRVGPSYTADTLQELHACGWTPAQIFFIIGADAFADIATWRSYPAILDAANFAVMARPGTTPEAALARTPDLRGRVRTLADAGQRTTTGVFLVEATTPAVSSSDIRARLHAGTSIDGLVPDLVARHIHRHHLYQTDNDLHGED